MYKIKVNASDDWSMYSSSATYIVFINALKTPPHIAFIHRNVYYSYGVSGTKILSKANAVLQKYLNKKIPLILFELDLELDNEFILQTYNAYSNLKLGASCMDPVKEMLTDFIKSNTSTIFAFNLIQLLTEQSKVNQVLSFLCTKHLDGKSELYLSTYSQEDINNCVNELKLVRS
jgi:hypothetical protein